MVTGEDIPAIPPAGFGSSDVVPEVIRERREFIPTQAEWSANNREILIRHGIANNTVTILFTVPDNQFFFMTSATLTIDASATGNGVLQEQGVANHILRIGVNSAHALTTNSTFPMPLKIEAGKNIVVTGSLNVLATATITGWLESKETP